MALAAAGPDARARRLAGAQPRHTPTRQADQQARLLLANQGRMAQNSSKVLLKSFFQALLQPALPTQAKVLQLGPALGAILRGNAAHGADLQDGSSGEACNQDRCGGSGVLGTQFSAATHSRVGTAPRELDHCFPCSSSCLSHGIATKKEQSTGPQ